MADLKPCPFCGGEAHVDRRDRVISIGCDACGYSRRFDGVLTTTPHGDSVSGVGSALTEYYNLDAYEEAAEAWNARWERTCHMQYVSLYDEECVDGIECDECGWTEIHDADEPVPARCPGCGSKVVA